MKKILYSCIALVLLTPPVFSYDKKLENILWTSPNVESIEYVYVINDNIEKSIEYLDDAIKQVNDNPEERAKKDARLLQLNFLKAFVYLNQKSNSLSKRETKALAKDLVLKNIEKGESLMKRHPEYSDVYSLVALSYFFYGRTGFSGMRFLASNKATVLEYMQKAMELNPNNPFARVSYANFDSGAPKIAGGVKSRGTETLQYPLDESWPKIYRFEYHLAKMINAQHTENQKLLDSEREIAEAMYPGNWRIGFALDGIDE